MLLSSTAIAQYPDFSETMKAAKDGDISAQQDLGVLYEVGSGTKQNYEEAIKWYAKAAEQGNATAQRNLAMMYSAGRGTQKSPKAALKWLLKSV